METVLRVAFFYVFILGGLRVLGKREFSEFSPFELVTLLLIPELASQASSARTSRRGTGAEYGLRVVRRHSFALEWNVGFV